MNDRESVRHQLNEWVAGRPWHNAVRDECCPDFSCCNPDKMWPKEMRVEFANADDQTQQEMCFAGLGKLLSEESIIYIIYRSSCCQFDWDLFSTELSERMTDVDFLESLVDTMPGFFIPFNYISCLLELNAKSALQII